MRVSPLKEKYQKEVVPKMMEIFGFKNSLAVPTIEKVVINMGVGEAQSEPKALESAIQELSLITGQRPIIKKARKTIAGFRLKRGQPIACMVTLRRQKMWDFLYKLIHVALPNVRDFKGLPLSSFNNGCYTIGIKEQIIFPEIEYDKIFKIRGMNITIVTTAKKEQVKTLLRLLGFPLQRE